MQISLAARLNCIEQSLAARLDCIERRMPPVSQPKTIPPRSGWDFVLAEGARHLAELAAAPEAIAVISPMPPEQTGIANFALRTFREAGYPVDIFARFRDAASYLALSCDEALAAAGITFLPIDLLPAARVRRRYLAQVWEIGNSDHILPVLASFAAQAAFPSDIPNFVYIHDPCLLNLLRKSLAARKQDWTEAVSCHYGIDVADNDDAALTQRGVLGARLLFSDIPDVHVLTNSQAASDLLARDWPEAQKRMHTLFLPVLPPAVAASAEPRDTIRIGTFGIPGTAKCSETIVAAFRILAREIDNLELVLGGYSAGPFVRRFGLQDIPGIKIFDSPSDRSLQELMQSCDLAVQLRQENFGESSGVVPQLIALGVPVIVSRLGAFAEYGEAVAYVPPRCSAETLAEAMRAELRGAGRRSAAERHYAKTHTPAAFCRKVYALAREVAPHRRLSEAAE